MRSDRNVDQRNLWTSHTIPLLSSVPNIVGGSSSQWEKKICNLGVGFPGSSPCSFFLWSSQTSVNGSCQNHKCSRMIFEEGQVLHWPMQLDQTSPSKIPEPCAKLGTVCQNEILHLSDILQQEDGCLDHKCHQANSKMSILTFVYLYQLEVKLLASFDPTWLNDSPHH